MATSKSLLGRKTYRELQGREEARDSYAQRDEADEGHDWQIEIVRDRHPLLTNAMAPEKCDYEYDARGMQDAEPEEGLHEELERENDEGENDERFARFFGDRGEEEAYEDRYEEEDSDMDIESDSDRDT